MKKARKGFTLVELLVVIAVIGILASMAMIGGSEATNTAKATRIVDEFQKLSAAMMMYYADNYASADLGTEKRDNILNGVRAYIKASDQNLLTSADTNVVGKYKVSVVEATATAPQTWWLTYTLEADNTRVGAILATKNARFNFKKTAETDGDAYDGTESVCYQVR